MQASPTPKPTTPENQSNGSANPETSGKVRMCPAGAFLVVRPFEGVIEASAFGDKIKVTKKGDDMVTEGGIYVPQKAQYHAERRATTGTVVHTGPSIGVGKKGLPITDKTGEVRSIREGDIVLWGRNLECTLEGRIPGYEDCVLLHEDDLLCVVESA